MRGRRRTGIAGVLGALFLLLSVTAPALAVEPAERLADPALEARARAISQELRCLVCQNQSIDDSNAPLAHDLRVLVRERLTAGDSDGQVIAFVTARYGDFVLLRPPFQPNTWLLWGTPAAVLLLGGGAVALYLSRRRAAGPESLTEEEQRRVEALLDASGGRRPDPHDS